MLVTVDLGTAKEFLSWDDEVDAFVVIEGATKDEYVGIHIICMNVVYFNETFREDYDDCFTLTIKANTTVVEEEFVMINNETTWVPPEIIQPKQPPVKQFEISELGFEPGPFNERQPIPYIADLSITGVLTIGWDRSMTAREDFEKINPARVGIKNATDLELAES